MLMTSSFAFAETSSKSSFASTVYDPVKTELVLNLVVTCTDPIRPGPNAASKDGERSEIWPIIGGRFDGPGIHGTVEAGGADLPVLRPDGVEVVDAFYRLKTDDGQIIIIHNKGLAYPIKNGQDYKYRLSPEFIAPKGKYDWLNKSIFVATLVYPVPKGMELARGPHQNDRLIQVLRLN
ncbi:DUF3237 domain-containing protein [Neokomagataea tanensis]|uniref:DUF3237 domain-containing protein n=3 Tax=Neokomagataea TaxID=1223423 RepID=A0A4Y6VAF9_9PROT|nr:DUF3237 domain-containing protein [Neokomagataea tanensis]QDH25506.1 DUF3237 domain-containing protein [Neokomagataea tanensis]